MDERDPPPGTLLFVEYVSSLARPVPERTGTPRNCPCVFAAADLVPVNKVGTRGDDGGSRYERLIAAAIS